MEIDRFTVSINSRSVVIDDNGFRVAVDPLESVEADIVILTSSKLLEDNKELMESMCQGSTCLIVPSDFNGEVNCPDVERTSSPESLDIFNVEIDPVTYMDINGYRFVMGDHSFFVQGRKVYTAGLKDVGKVDTAFLYVEPDHISEIVKTGVFLKPGLTIPYGFDNLSSVEADIRSLKADFEDRNLSFDSSFLEN